MKIDLLRIDLKAGKHWMQHAGHDEAVKERREAIRAKHRKRHLENKKHEDRHALDRERS